MLSNIAQGQINSLYAMFFFEENTINVFEALLKTF